MKHTRLDYKTFLATLDRDVRIGLTRKRNAPALRNFAMHMFLIAATGIWVANGWVLWPLALAVLGISLIFLFTLEHECSHNTAFSGRWLNQIVGRAAGLIVLVPLDWFRFFHFEHHRHTNDPAKDPELASAKPETWPELIWYLSGLPLWWSMIVQIWRNACGRPGASYIPRQANRRLQAEAVITMLVYGLALASLTVSPMVFWLWLLPIMIGQPFLRLYLLAEHGRCPQVADMFANSRTTLTSRFVRFLAWNMPYHAEHHAYPAVPFHRLPELHALARPHLSVVQDGYVEFSRDYAGALGKETSTTIDTRKS
jgi:fatty acid desaturase